MLDGTENERDSGISPPPFVESLQENLEDWRGRIQKQSTDLKVWIFQKAVELRENTESTRIKKFMNGFMRGFEVSTRFDRHLKEEIDQISRT